MRTGGVPGRGAVELLDGAIHLLRRASAAPLLAWSVGTVPFVLAVPLFWAEMRFSPAAREQLPAASLLLALLYLWMKYWQHCCAARLRALAERGQPPRRGLRQWLSLIATQVRVQPTSLLLLPAAALATVPFGWVYAYYQGLTITGETGAARRQARLWPGQNHRLIAALGLCTLVVFVNLLGLLLMIPGLLLTFFGVETAMARNPLGMLNSTTLLVAVGLSYLVLGPVVKAAYVLRTFDGDAITTGADLLQQLADVQERGLP